MCLWPLERRGTASCQQGPAWLFLCPSAFLFCRAGRGGAAFSSRRPHARFPGEGVRCVVSKLLTLAHCHGAYLSSAPPTLAGLFLRPHLSPRGQEGSSTLPLTPSCHCQHPVPMVPTRLHRSKCPLALPQDEPRRQLPQAPGVGWLSLTEETPVLAGVDTA